MDALADTSVASLAEEGVLDRGRSEAAIAWLNEASQSGTFFAYGGLIVARGTVPAS